MELSQLKNFLAVFDCGSISKAAHNLGTAQPALSQSVVRLEKSLGVRLFDRSRRGAQPTQAAVALVDDVRAALVRLQEASRKAAVGGKGLAGPLTIGIVSSALFDVLPAALRALRKHAPDIRVQLKELSNAELAAALELGSIDLALMHAPVSVRGHVYEKVLRQDKLIAAVPADLAKSMSSPLTLPEIAAVGLVLYPQDQLPVLYTGIADGLRKAGCSVKINMHANRTLTVLACVAGGQGVGLLPSWIRTVGFPGVTFVDIDDQGLLPGFDLVAMCPARFVHVLALMFPDKPSV